MWTRTWQRGPFYRRRRDVKGATGWCGSAAEALPNNLLPTHATRNEKEERERARALYCAPQTSSISCSLLFSLQPAYSSSSLSLSFFFLLAHLSAAFLLYIFNCDITDFLWCRCPLAAQHRYRIGWTTQWQVHPTCWSADKLGGHWICDCSTSSVADLLFVILRNVCPVIIMSFIFFFLYMYTKEGLSINREYFGDVLIARCAHGLSATRVSAYIKRARPHRRNDESQKYTAQLVSEAE